MASAIKQQSNGQQQMAASKYEMYGSNRHRKHSGINVAKMAAAAKATAKWRQS